MPFVLPADLNQPRSRRPRWLLWLMGLILLLSLCWLQGCSVRTVERTTIELRVPPLVMRTECKPNPPPSETDILTAYIRYPKAKSEWEAMFLLMKEEWDKQTLQVGLCNDKIKALNGWYDEQKATLEKYHDATGGTDLPRR